MKITEVSWTEIGVSFVADGVGAGTEPRRDHLNLGFVVFHDIPGGTDGHWEDVLGWKFIGVEGRNVPVIAPCEDPVAVAECRLRMAVMGFGLEVPGVEPKLGPRPVMTIAEAKAALRSGAWGFEKVRLP